MAESSTVKICTKRWYMAHLFGQFAISQMGFLGEKLGYSRKTRSMKMDFVKLGFRRWNGGLNWAEFGNRKGFRGIERGYVCFYMGAVESGPQGTIKGT